MADIGPNSGRADWAWHCTSTGLSADYEIVATVICGDNYFGSNLKRLSRILN